MEYHVVSISSIFWLQVNTIHETFRKLEQLQIQLSALRLEIESELLQSYGETNSCKSDGATVLRAQIIKGEGQND
jgi:DNA integrity scanning protein DisA with diadenylate cyclase activity